MLFFAILTHNPVPQQELYMLSFAYGRNCHSRNLRCKIYRIQSNKNSCRRWNLLWW